MADGTLRAIFIECSYSDAIDDSSLYGHLCPRHLVTELSVLATKVEEVKQLRQRESGKRKQDDTDSDAVDEMSPRAKRVQSVAAGKSSQEDTSPDRVSTSRGTRSRSNRREARDSGQDEAPPDDREPIDSSENYTGRTASDPQPLGPHSNPLVGLNVYIIHIKDHLTDGPPPGKQILEELKTQGEAASLGCEFHIPNPGEGVWI